MSTHWKYYREQTALAETEWENCSRSSIYSFIYIGLFESITWFQRPPIPLFCPFSCYKRNIPRPIFPSYISINRFFFVWYCLFGFDRKELFPLVFPNIVFPQFEHPYTTVIWFSSWIGSGLPVRRNINHHSELILLFNFFYWDFKKRLVKPPLRQNL